MSEYIKLEDALDLAVQCITISNITYDKVCRTIDNLPTIDIVRCKDCKYSRVYALDSNEKPRRWCVRGLVKAVDDDDYCSCGE